MRALWQFGKWAFTIIKKLWEFRNCNNCMMKEVCSKIRICAKQKLNDDQWTKIERRTETEKKEEKTPNERPK